LRLPHATAPVLAAPEGAARRSLRYDLACYARTCLAIRTKGAAIMKLRLNRAQQYLHERLETQKAATGRVRAIILKGRQQGCSTYVGARFYHQATQRRGVRVFILTHARDATDNLFGMVERFHAQAPALVKPDTGAANAKELSFDALDSGYRVGTAGAKDTGRSQTLQLFHGSEVAFWPHAETHGAGVLQAVPDAPGTEIILESTANGLGNLFHATWQDATKGVSDYQAIFIPWFWQDEYRKPVRPGFALDAEEREYQALYGLTLEQMAWRRAKIIELKGTALFQQEYPATPAEAFAVDAEASFIASAAVRAARGAKVEPAGALSAATGALVIGVDPARFGDDHTAIIRRRGRCAFGLERHHKLDTMAVAGLCAAIIRAERPRKMFIDVGGLGAGVVDRLRELNFGAIVEAVNFGGRPVVELKDHGGAVNRRAEMWSEMRDWLEAGIKEAPVQIPDDDALHADLTGPRFTYDSNQRVKLESKEHMRARGVKSPNDADALALTFAAPIHETWRPPTPHWLRAMRRQNRPVLAG
jgi:hypothetical protein